MADEITPPTVRDLRRAWKPIKERTDGVPEREAIRIRLHRCFSWMHEAEKLRDDARMADARLVWRWIALNALYSRWNDLERWPEGDRETLGDFTRRIVRADRDERIASLLRTHRGLAESIVANEFLAKRFWQDPTDEAARSISDGSKHHLHRALNDGVTLKALDRVLERVYFLRCQLVHGAATFDGEVNREPVRHADRFLELLLPEIVLVIVEHAWEQDWDGLCYPPLR